METKMLRASVYYKNDQPGGFAASLLPEAYLSLEAQCESVWQGFKSEGLTDDATAAFLIDQLEEYGKQKPLEEIVSLIVVMNIIQLVQHGYLTQDEYNGTQFAYVNADSGIEPKDLL